jgi:hypothetical protein
LDIFLRKLVDYPPVKSKEALHGWIVMMDVVHYAFIETFQSLFEETIRLTTDEEEVILRAGQVIGKQVTSRPKEIVDLIKQLRNEQA